jgi:hypothetical protein
MGSWVLWKIETRSRVRHSNMTKLVTSDLIKQAMNVLTREGRNENAIASAVEDETQQPAVVSETEDAAEAVEEEIPEGDVVEPRETDGPEN